MQRLAAACSLVAVVAAAPARADEWIGEQPGRHRSYRYELEPHGDFAFLGVGRDVSGIGLGARMSFPIVKDGFIRTLNNSVAVTTGLDFISYSGCYGLRFGDCSSVSALWLPVALQWNFHLTPDFDAFAELGGTVRRVSFGDNCGGTAGSTATGTDVTVDCGNRATLDLRPAFWLGGRYRLSDGSALTLRLGADYWTAGASFFY